MMDHLTVSAHDSAESVELILPTKTASVLTWDQPKVEDESRQELMNSSVEDGERQGVEEETKDDVPVEDLASEHKLSDATTSPCGDESVVVEQTSDEQIVMDEMATQLFNVEKDQKQAMEMEEQPTQQSEQPADEEAVNEQVVKTKGGWLTSKFSCNPTCCAAPDVGAFDVRDTEDVNKQLAAEQSPVNEPIEEPVAKAPSSEEPTEMPVSKAPSIEEPSQVSEENVVEKAVIEKVLVKNKAGKSWTGKIQKKKALLKKLSKKLSGKKSKNSGPQPIAQEKLPVIVENPATIKSTVAEEEVVSIKPSDSKTASVENPEVVSLRKTSSSLMDKDEEDEKEVEAEHQTNDPSSPMKKSPAKRKTLSLANILGLGACSVKPETLDEFKIDRVESDGYEGGSDITNENETAPKGLFSCGVVPTSRRKKSGIFDRLDSVQSDAAVGQTSEIGEDELRALTEQVHLSFIGEDDTAEEVMNESTESEPQRRTVSSIPAERREIKVKKSSSIQDEPQHEERASPPIQDKSRQQAAPPEKKEIKLKKTNSKEDKSRQRAAPSEKKEINLKKTNSKENKPRQRAAPSEKKEKAKQTNSRENNPRQQAAPAPEKRVTKVEKKRKNTESECKATKPHRSSYGTVIVPQRSSEKPLGKPSELDEILQITKSNSSGLAASSSSTDDDTFVGHMEAKFDLYNEKYGLIQRFGKHLDELKEKQAEVHAKELEVEEAQEAVERATTISTMKRRKKELARIQQQLEKLRKEEEAVKVPVARLHDLLNTQLDSTSTAEESSTLLDARKLFMCVPGIAACHGNNADEEDNDSVHSDTSTINTLDNQLIAELGRREEKNDDERVRNSRIEHVLDVICG